MGPWSISRSYPLGKTETWPLLLSFSHFSLVRLFANPWTVAHQAPLLMGFSRQEYRSGLPFPSPGDLPDPGIELGSPVLQADSLPLRNQGSLKDGHRFFKIFSFLHIFAIYHLSSLYQEVEIVSLLSEPVDCVACLSQWNTINCDTNKGLKSICVLRLVLLRLLETTRSPGTSIG